MQILRNLFKLLKDTPNSYEGQGGKVLTVNAEGTGVEFTDSIMAPEDITPTAPTIELYDVGSGLPAGTYTYKVQGVLNEDLSTITTANSSLLLLTSASAASNSLTLPSSNSIKITVPEIDSSSVKGRLVYGLIPSGPYSSFYQLITYIPDNNGTVEVYDLGRTFPTGASTYGPNAVLNDIGNCLVPVKSGNTYLSVYTTSRRMWKPN